MSEKAFTNELERALARPDIEELRHKLAAHHKFSVDDDLGLSPEWTDECNEVLMSGLDDPETALAFVVLASATYDDNEYLCLMAAGPLEDVLREPSLEILDRIMVEARRNPRFLWMLSVPYPHAISAEAGSRIYKLIDYGHCDIAPLPARPWA